MMQPLKQVMLPKADVAATVEILRPEHLAQTLALQEETRATLPDAQKMFILPQTPDYFRDLLAQRTGVLIGVRARGQLIAQMAVKGPMKLCDARDSYAITRNDIEFHHASEFESVVVAKSMTVHPTWRGNDLSATMLQCILALPMVRTADHLFAQMSVDNVRSWDMFLRNGFGIVAACVDMADKKPRFILQRPSLGFVLHDRAAAHDLDHRADFAAIERLTQREGLVGRLDHGVAFKLAFHASLEHAASWTEEAAGIIA